jgi:hypothetical protein
MAHRVSAHPDDESGHYEKHGGEAERVVRQYLMLEKQYRSRTQGHTPQSSTWASWRHPMKKPTSFVRRGPESLLFRRVERIEMVLAEAKGNHRHTSPVIAFVAPRLCSHAPPSDQPAIGRVPCRPTPSGCRVPAPLTINQHRPIPQMLHGPKKAEELFMIAHAFKRELLDGLVVAKLVTV